MEEALTATDPLSHSALQYMMTIIVGDCITHNPYS